MPGLKEQRGDVKEHVRWNNTRNQEIQYAYRWNRCKCDYRTTYWKEY